MNFFERQVVARRNSRMLLVLFVAAIVVIVAALDVAASIVWYFCQMFIDRPLQSVPKWLHIAVIGSALATILVTSLRKTLEVHRGGGLAVARMLDGRQIVPLKASPLERRLLNIVQEMAIASGTRVPIVFVLDQHGGINAFAAGFDGKLCAIVVTRGALERLNRNELQGVIGHEFSHIVNGDMAFNLQMIGVLAGLTFIGGAGDYLLKAMSHTGKMDFRVGTVMFLSGISLLTIGYIGLLAGQVIKARIAREREYLADAGSVQFTRNPEGLAGALDQVRRSHSMVVHLHAEDVSHLFFAEAVYLEEERMLSTHPTVGERIDRLAPTFRMSEYRESRLDPMAELDRSLKAQPPRETDARFAVSPAEVLGLVGSFEDSDVRAATTLVNALPAGAEAALKTRDGAAALAIALIQSSRDAVADAERVALRSAGFEALAVAASTLRPTTESLPMAQHLPIADLALAELMRQPEDYRREIARALETVIDADREVSVYRYACLNLMRSQLAPGPRKPGSKPLAAARDEVVLILSLIAYAGCNDKADFDRAFEAGVKEMELGAAVAPAARERCDAHTLTQAIERLRDLAPLPKARLIRGLHAAVTADHAVGPVETALMRMMGAALDCPLPLGK
ncbi:MAG TPA: M48 family metalloprotease [Usitatibacter sp.]|nr:M48 family metalloprotease [Usitatibacter sp.]